MIESRVRRGELLGSRDLKIAHSVSDLTEELLLQQDAAGRKVTCAG
jgi:hypothetical protein